MKKITLRQSEDRASVSEQFLQGMVNRMCVGYHRYGDLEKEKIRLHDRIKTINARLQMYLDTGNTEMLMDAANFCMIEFQDPRVANPHFTPMEHNESPGISVGGKMIHMKDKG